MRSRCWELLAGRLQDSGTEARARALSAFRPGMEAAADGASSLAEAEDGSPLSDDEPESGVGDSPTMDAGDPGTYPNSL